ncbi:hypothetical protein VPH5P1C_0202 [Vibrio phage 5P1c]
MTTITTETQIQFVNAEKDAGTMQRTIQNVYDLTLEIQSAQEAIKSAIENGYEVYKDKISSEAKKGDYSAFIKKSIAELQEGKVSSEMSKLENILDYQEQIKKVIK